MMGWPLARIVDNLDRGRVLFDFNNGTSGGRGLGEFLSAENFSPLGEPTWETSSIGIIEGTRTITLPVIFTGFSAESAVSRLSEILTRSAPTWLMWQDSASSAPVWFRLHGQTSGGTVDLQFAHVDLYRWTVDLLADAFALGARQTLTATTQLAQAGQPMMPPYEITDPIVGDAPAPLNLDIDAGDLTGYQTQLMSWAMDPAATVDPWAGTPPNPDLTLTGTESGRIGELAQVPPPGQFRCLLYVTRPTTYNAGKFKVSIDDGFGVPIISTPEVIVSPGTSLTDGRWVDCGRLNLPAGVDFTDLPEDALEPLDWMVSVLSTSSSGPWNIGNFTLIPVQTVSSRAATSALGVRLGVWPGGVLAPSAGDALLRVDGERSRAGVVDKATGKWVINMPPVVDGSFPRVHPGARNFLMFLPRLNDVATHTYGTSGETTMWYYPRHLHIGAR